MKPVVKAQGHRAAIVALLQEESGITLASASEVLAHFNQAVVDAVRCGYDRAVARAIACASCGMVGGEG